MDQHFEIKRQEMMKELSKRRRDNAVKRKVATMQKSNTDQPAMATIPLERKRIAVYGADSFFIKNFLNTLKLSNEIYYHADVEKLTEIVLDTGIVNIAIDLDDPTDWRKSVDVFTTIKTINPNAKFYVCTKDPEWVQAKTLEKQGGMILKKPVDFDHLYRSMK
jgi:hypothetical protein